MAQQTPTNPKELKVSFIGYISLVFAIVFFSGYFATEKGWLQLFDFSSINGHFGTMNIPEKATFMGMAGVGARDGFLFGLTLIPSVMFALGVIEVIEHLGGLTAAQKLLTPILRPVFGLPGISGLAIIASVQAMDACAGMMRSLHADGYMTEKEKVILTAWAFGAGGTITNYFAIISGLFAFFTVPIGLPLAIVFCFKLLAANLMRFYLSKSKA